MNKRKINEVSLKKEFVFNIMYKDQMAQRFVDFYDLLANPIKNKTNDTESSLQTKLETVMRKVIENKLWELVIRSDDDQKNLHQIGDDVRVSYCPASQRYIDHYEEQGFVGKIVFIDRETDNMFFLCISDDKSKEEILIRSLETDGCHFFGMSRGYDYFLEKIDLISTKKRKIDPIDLTSE